MKKPITILGFAGSLRKGSYNKALLRAAVELAPSDVRIEVFDLEGIPVFNQDLEEHPPKRVREFKAKIRAADALLIATPEYNYSVPGVLKNAIDWASRPYGDNAFEDKPVALMSASNGMLGGARAQYQLTDFRNTQHARCQQTGNHSRICKRENRRERKHQGRKDQSKDKEANPELG
jgi:chromate reductase